MYIHQSFVNKSNCLQFLSFNIRKIKRSLTRYHMQINAIKQYSDTEVSGYFRHYLCIKSRDFTTNNSVTLSSAQVTS